MADVEVKSEPPAKKIKVEAGSDLKTAETLLLSECKKHPQWIAPQDQTSMAPPKDYAEHTLDGNKAFENLDKGLLSQAVGNLLKRSRLVIVNHPKGGRFLRYVSEEVAQQQVERFGGLTTNELLVYQKIEEAKTKGLFHRDLKSRTGITNPNTIRTIIEKLMKRKLIKDFTSVHTGKKKMYILAELEPSAELTGGNWYTQGELDMDLVETSSKLAAHFFKSRGRKGGSVSEVRDFIKAKGVITCDLTVEEVLQLVETLLYDSKIERLITDDAQLPAQERTFRVLNPPSVSLDHYSTIPSAVCPAQPLYPMLGSGWEGKEVEVLEGFFTLESKQLLYWCTLTPIDIKKVERVVVFFHGYTGSCAWLEFNVMATMAKLGNCAVIGVDMPGHGRSDGDHVFIDGWHPYVNCAQQFVDKFCTAKVQQWSAQSGKELKMFAMGESMGGGIVMTLSLEQPRLFRLRELDVPCLIMHARGDTVTDPQLSEMLFAVAKTKDKSLKLYENAMHMDPLHGGPKMKELLETVYSDILEWMAQRS